MIQMLDHPSKQHELEKHKSELAKIADIIQIKHGKYEKINTLTWKSFQSILKTNFHGHDQKLKMFDTKFSLDKVMTLQMLKNVCDFTGIIIFYNAIGDIIALYDKSITVFINVDFPLF
jgi:hypothetical protein